MMCNFRIIIFLLVFVPTYSHAYLGPGMGGGIITATLGLLVAIFAAIFGTFVPLILAKNKIDPALATGPFITTINDILGLFIYFIIGQAIL